MINKVKSLIEMQSFDDKIADKEKLKKELPKRLQGLLDSVNEAKLAVEEVEEEKKQVVLNQKDRELEIKQNKEKMLKYEEQLTSIKTNKEYKALNSEIASLNTQNSEHESEILSLMEQENQCKAMILDRTKVLDEKKAELKAQEDDLKEEIAGLDGEIDALKLQRNEIAKTLPNNVVKQYKRLIINRNRKAVAFESEGACSACGFKVRPQVIVELDKLNKLNFCDNCGRFLVKKPLH